MGLRWRAAPARWLCSLAPFLVRWDQRWLRYGWIQRCGCSARPRPLPNADPWSLLPAAYDLRQRLAQDSAMADVQVGLEGGQVVLLVGAAASPALLGQLRALVDGAVEVRPVAEAWPLCHSLDGDHCNGDYDRS